MDLVVGSNSSKITTFNGTAESFEKCENVSAQLFNRNTCNYTSCSFSGVYMPPIHQTFNNSDIYAFSYFYDIYAEPFNQTNNFTVGQIKKGADAICSNKTSTNFHPNAKSPLSENQHWCMDLGFLYNLLHKGYNISDSREIKTAKKINGVETGWCLGAALHLLDDFFLGNGTC